MSKINSWSPWKRQHWRHFQEQLKAAAAVAVAVVSIAKKAGFSISSDELKEAPSGIYEEELKVVGGGTHFATEQLGTLLCHALFRQKPTIPTILGVIYFFMSRANPINQPPTPCTIESSWVEIAGV